MSKLHLITIMLISIVLLTACTPATHYKDERYNPETEQIEKVRFTPYYQLNTELIPGQVEVTLITQLNKDNLRSIYRLKKLTRRLTPNDYMDQSDSTIYLKNMTQAPVHFQILNISIENQRLPLSSRDIKLSDDETLSLPLGQVMIDLRKLHLISHIEYIAQSHQEIMLDMSRIEQTVEPEQKQDQAHEFKEEDLKLPDATEISTNETSDVIESNSSDTDDTNNESVTETVTNWFKSIQQDLFE